MVKNFLIRQATESDSRNIFEWRNDLLTLGMSHNKKTIEWKTHIDWFINTLKSENSLILICENNIDKIGVVRFDISNINAKVSINLNPGMRGKNLSKECLIKSIKFFSKKFPKIQRLEAEVSNDNIASKKIFTGSLGLGAFVNKT